MLSIKKDDKELKSWTWDLKAAMSKVYAGDNKEIYHLKQKEANMTKL